MGGLQLEVPISEGLRVPGQTTSTDVRRSKSATGPLEISKTEAFFKGQSFSKNEASALQPLNRTNGDSDISLKVPESHLLKRTASAGLVWFQDLWRKKPNQEPIGPTLTSKYVVVKRRIGSGTTSQIQLVRKIGDEAGKNLAVKLFYKNWGDSADVEARVGEEFCLTSGLTHKNVIKVYELIQDDLGHWCQVMDYCPGGDLRNAIQNGFLNHPEIDCCFRQLIDGVAYMHSMGIAHRDIKPDNVLIDDDCVLKLSDFGCSEAFYDSIHIPCNKSSGMIGSEPYMAPEILKAQQSNSVTTYDARLADIWACGIVYLVMSLGHIPFKMADESRDRAYAQYVATRLAEEEYTLFGPLSKGAKDSIVKILDPDTETRATMNDIIHSQWFNSIEVCHKGQADSAFHSHFSQDYSPKRST